MIKLKKTRDLDLEMGHARRDLDWSRQFAVAMNRQRHRQSGMSAFPRTATPARCAATTVRSRSSTGTSSFNNIPLPVFGLWHNHAGAGGMAIPSSQYHHISFLQKYSGTVICYPGELRRLHSALNG
jgi:hypothetical protein